MPKSAPASNGAPITELHSSGAGDVTCCSDTANAPGSIDTTVPTSSPGNTEGFALFPITLIVKSLDSEGTYSGQDIVELISSEIRTSFRYYSKIFEEQ